MNTHIRKPVNRLLLALYLIFCLSPPLLAEEIPRMVISGSSTVMPLVRALQPYFEQETGFVAEVRGGGSSMGYEEVITQIADVGMLSRPLSPDEQTGLKQFELARDSITVIVNRLNPISNLSLEALRDIYTAKTQHWSALGRYEGPIVALVKQYGRGTRAMFDQRLKIKTTDDSHFTYMGAHFESMVYVASDPQAIAYVATSVAKKAIASGMGIKIITIDGQMPFIDDQLNPDYSLTRPLYLAIRQDAREIAHRFVDFALSPKAADILIRHNVEPAR